jgi:MoaE-MoaD fusion protein
MRVKILAFGMLREELGETGCLELPAGATVGDLVQACRERTPDKRGLWETIAVAVNQEYASSRQVLSDGDEVALLPPVSGGAGKTKTTSGSGRTIALVRERIDSGALAGSLKAGEDGALVVFDGVVRNNSRGRRTRYLFYEAYEEMALTQMQQLAARALKDFPIRDLAIVHRLGRLEIGESSVAIAVASAHRAAAFDACRWLIDTLKQSVPIWKKEFFEDGAVWAQGDAFPAALRPQGKAQRRDFPPGRNQRRTIKPERTR